MSLLLLRVWQDLIHRNSRLATWIIKLFQVAAKSSGHGGARKGAGRKSKAQEQSLIEKLGPLETIAHEQLKIAVKSGEKWALEMYFGYMYGKPTQRVEQSGPDGGPIQFSDLDATKLSAKERDAMRRLILKAAEDGG